MLELHISLEPPSGRSWNSGRVSIAALWPSFEGPNPWWKTSAVRFPQVTKRDGLLKSRSWRIGVCRVKRQGKLQSASLLRCVSCTEMRAVVLKSYKRHRRIKRPV